MIETTTRELMSTMLRSTGARDLNILMERMLLKNMPKRRHMFRRDWMLLYSFEWIVLWNFPRMKNSINVANWATWNPKRNPEKMLVIPKVSILHLEPIRPSLS
jgi:hypothetical protein